MEALEVPHEQRPRLLAELGHGDFVGLENALAELSIDERSLELLLRVPQLRGGPDILHGPPGPVADAVAGLRLIHELLAADVAERVIFDLGLSRAPGYYTGAVFEVYDPAVGMPIGGGGRYDHLLGQFGRDLPAVGFALEVEKLHQALAAEERLAEGAR
jgi:ATP phosphoribosyltransferase regulatory subunit